MAAIVRRACTFARLGLVRQSTIAPRAMPTRCFSAVSGGTDVHNTLSALASFGYSAPNSAALKGENHGMPVSEILKASPMMDPTKISIEDLSHVAPGYSDCDLDILDGPKNNEGGGILAIKRTFQPSNLVRKRRHGFLSRLRTVGGRRVLNRRKQKNRTKLSA